MISMSFLSNGSFTLTLSYLFTSLLLNVPVDGFFTQSRLTSTSSLFSPSPSFPYSFVPTIQEQQQQHREKFCNSQRIQFQSIISLKGTNTDTDDRTPNVNEKKMENNNKEEERIENVVIIGSGPAGHTAAIYAGRANLDPVVFEGTGLDTEKGLPGGQLMTTTDVENFPGFPEGIQGPELMDRMRKQAIKSGATCITEDINEVTLTERPFTLISSSGNTVKAQSIIIATGATAKRVGLPSEKIYWNRGISACAICDGAAPIFKDQILAVIGGGDSATEEALYLSKYSPKIHLLVRSDKMRAAKTLQDRVLNNPKIEVHYDSKVIDVVGMLDNSSEKEILDYDVSKKGSPLMGIKFSQNGKEKTLDCRGVFYAIGHKPNTDLFKEEKSRIDLYEGENHGYIKTIPRTGVNTNVEGVFAAGDVQDPSWRQAVTAAGTGCMAALAAERYLTENNLYIERKSSIKEGDFEANESFSVVNENKTKDQNEKEKNPSMPTATMKTNEILKADEKAFKEMLEASNKPFVVLFTSKTCGPCRILKPILSKVVIEYGDRVDFLEIDIEESYDLTVEREVMGTPTLQIYHQKEQVSTIRGIKKKNDYIDALEGILKN